MNKANFNIDELRPIDLVKKYFTPALFFHGKSDTFILPKHSILL